MKKMLVFALLAAAVMAACAPVTPVAPEAANNQAETCVPVGSDNGIAWPPGSCVTIDTRLYVLDVQIAGNMANNQTVNGSVSGMTVGGYGGVSGSIWTEGKGVVLVKLMSINPDFPGIKVGDYIIIKTTDLKAMALPVGSRATMFCNKDPEATSPLYVGQTFTTDRVTLELDDCRMQSPKVILPAP